SPSGPRQVKRARLSSTWKRPAGGSMSTRSVAFSRFQDPPARLVAGADSAWLVVRKASAVAASNLRIVEGILCPAFNGFGMIGLLLSRADRMRLACRGRGKHARRVRTPL